MFRISQMKLLDFFMKKPRFHAGELPQIMRTAQKAPWQENIEFQAERRRASGASPVFSWMRSWL